MSGMTAQERTKLHASAQARINYVVCLGWPDKDAKAFVTWLKLFFHQLACDDSILEEYPDSE